MQLQLAHVSDSHLGFSQYPKKAPSGRPQREQDFVRAWASAVDDIIQWDPALVIHSGDFYDRPVVSLRHQKQGQDSLARLAKRGDGKLRAVVVISGNHDQPADPREPCALELDAPIPGVHIVTSRYTQIDLTEGVEAGLYDESLRGVVIHAIPHDVLKTIDFDEVIPVEGKINILTVHGVVGGSELYKRTIGREYALPIEVAARGWDYVAMGHWHKRCPVAVGGYKENTTPIWYAGSVENNGFADITDGNGTGRGYLRVGVEKGKVPAVTGVDLPIRAMFKLDAIDCEGLTPDEITAALLESLKNSDTSGAVVWQPVTGVSRDVWSLVDTAAVRSAAASCVWYEAKPSWAGKEAAAGTAEGEVKTDLQSVLEKIGEELLSADSDKDSIITMCRDLLDQALDLIGDESKGA